MLFVSRICTCEHCGEEIEEGYRLLQKTICGECLEDIYFDLEKMFG